MKKRNFPNAYRLTVLFLLPVLLLCAVSIFNPSAFAAEETPTVYLPENRFADFQFEQSEKNAVLISVTNLDDRIPYKDFQLYLVLKTRLGADVPFSYQALSNGALIHFTLEGESVYLTLKEELNRLPAAVRTDPEIATTVPVTVDSASYLAATSSVRSGTVTLKVSSLEQNDGLLRRTDGYFAKNKLKIDTAYHFELELRHLKIGAETTEPLYFGSDGNPLKLRVELPDYNKKYGYALITDLGAQGVSVKTPEVTESNGYYFLDIELRRNGAFSVVAYRNDDFPWWATLLIVGGCLVLSGGGAILGFAVKKKRNPKDRMKKKENDSEKSSEADTNEKSSAPNESSEADANEKSSAPKKSSAPNESSETDTNEKSSAPKKTVKADVNEKSSAPKKSSEADVNEKSSAPKKSSETDANENRPRRKKP